MQVEGQFPGEIQDALSKGLLKRLPLTFLPFVNQQLSQWGYLFPNERRSTERLLLYVASMTPEQSAELFRDVVDLEEKMGVSQWEFSTSEQTIQNSSLLARSPYYQNWRRAVQAVFDAADNHAQNANGAEIKEANRLVLLGLPRILPTDAATVWHRWQGIGRPLRLDLTQSGERRSALDILLTGMPSAESGSSSAGLLDASRRRASATLADTWVVDGGSSLVNAVLNADKVAQAKVTGILLSYGRLDLYRQNFSHEMNTMHKDLADADAVFDRLRKADVTPWCPAEVAGDPAIREFLRSLYLSGNGAVIFSNSFVEWAASEAIRRARPAFLAAQFGVRAKVKPFTGVAVFDNPELVNPLPPVDDLPGSAVDAQMLALYVWLAACRYDEYRRSTVCVCVAESLEQAYVVAPAEFPVWSEHEPLSLDRLGQILHAWIA